MSHIYSASSLLNYADEKEPNYDKNIKLAAMNIAKSSGWIETYESEIPRRLISWIGGVELGLQNGMLGVDKEEFESAVKDLKSFTDGYRKETGKSQTN